MTNQTLKILLSSHAQDGAERINHLFRNAGQAAQTHRITSLEDLSHCLNDEHWDLALCEQQNTVIDMNHVLEHMITARVDTPVILLTNEVTNDMIVDGLSRGAQDVVKLSNHDHLLYAANREVSNLHIRRRHSDLERSLNEVNCRFETLMAQADDAVAYVLDGMHVNVNDAYAITFGIEDIDEFLGIPVVDLISEQDQEKFKVFSRHYNENTEQELALNCCTPEGEQFDALIKFAPAKFDDEECTQIIVRRDIQQQTAPVDAVAVSAPIESLPSSIDPMTGLETRYSMVEQLDAFLSENEQGCLLYISINEFSQLKSRLGLSGSRTIRHGVAGILKDFMADAEDAAVAHYGEDSFTVLLPTYSDNEAMIKARKLCEKIEQHIFDIDNQTAQCSCCVGVVDFSKARLNDSTEALDTAYLALEEARQLFADDNSIPGIILYRPGANDKVETLYDVRELVTENRLQMLFQPVINLHGQAMEYYETTLRLFDLDGEEIPVDGLFQAMTHKAGDTSLDKWLVVEGTKNLKVQRDQGHKTFVTINLTQNALLDEKFGKWLGVAMKAAQVAPEYVTLQFNETTIAHYLKQAIRFRQELSEWNFKFSLCQFGRGQESFKVLQHFPVDYAFVDASYSMMLQKDPTNTEGLKNILDRLEEHKVSSVVPYVENAATLASLWQMNTHYIQGHYLQSPSDAMDYEFADA